MRINGIEYRTRTFSPSTKFSNSTVYCDNIGFGEIGSLVQISEGDDPVREMFVNQLQHIGYAARAPFLLTVRHTKQIRFVTIDRVRKPEFQVRVDNTIYITKLPNVWETD